MASTIPIVPTQIFARECLIARRLVERGVRFIEVALSQRGRRPLGSALRPEDRAIRTTPAPSTSRSPGCSPT